jgi:cytochrome c-type biogenesis protein CcmF
LAWKRGDLAGVAQRLMAAAGVALVVMAATFAVLRGGPVLAPFLFGIAAYVMIGTMTDLVERIALFKVPARTALARAAGLPRSDWGTVLAHLGLGITLLGIVGETQFGAERVAEMKPGQTISLAGYDLHFDGFATQPGPNYQELVARFTVRTGNNEIGVMTPSRRTFPSLASTRTEAALMARGFSQLYLSLGDPAESGAIAVRLYHKPLVLLIWLGALVMAFGGALSLSDRRLRVGAPRPAKRKAAMQPAE